MEGNPEMLSKIGVKRPCGKRFCQEKYNIYLTNFGQNATFWTFSETTRVLAISAGRRDSKNRKISFIFSFFG
jgi:hypothetical protein